MLSTLPPEIVALYSSPANDPIPLWKGPIHFISAGGKQRGRGDVQVNWLPTASVDFRMVTNELALAGSSGTLPDAGRVTLWGLGASGEVFLRSTNVKFTVGSPVVIRHHGLFRAPIKVGSRRPVPHLQFHLPNFPNYLGAPVSTGTGEWRRARVTAEFGRGWRVDIDALPNIKELTDELLSRGGYAVTHTAILEQRSGRAFSARLGLAQLEMLGMALSFARGGWSQPMLAAGIETNGSRLWEEWGVPVLDPAVTRPRWFVQQSPESLASLIAGFAARWSNRAWREPLRRAVTLYIEANQTPRVEIETMLGQAALELLAWTLLVSDGSTPPAVFNTTWNAAERIRRLLQMASIPTDVPSQFSALASLGGPSAPGDGPERIVFLRNRYVHPPKRTTGNWPLFQPAIEGSRLTLHYLELAILFAVGYRGVYWNRLDTGSDNTPWP